MITEIVPAIVLRATSSVSAASAAWSSGRYGRAASSF